LREVAIFSSSAYGLINVLASMVEFVKIWVVLWTRFENERNMKEMTVLNVLKGFFLSQVALQEVSQSTIICYLLL
jgi:hypothetical protein